MNHQEAVKLLPWYVNGTLEAEERRLVQGHLKRCFQCKTQLEEWQTIDAVLGELGREAPQPPANLPRQVLEQIQPQVRKAGPRRLSKPSPPWWRSQRMFQVAAVILLAIVGTHNLYLRQELDQLSQPQSLPPVQISSEIRGSAQLEIPQQARWIHLQVEVPPIPLDRSYSELGYEIVSAQGQHVLFSGKAGVAERLDLFLPAARMEAGRYTLVLSGIGNGQTEEISTYRIDLDRK